MKILAIIPARGGSKGIKDKNITNFCGKPLIHWTISAAINSKLIDKVIVSTDSRKIKKIANNYEVEKNELRPSKISEDNTPMIDVINYELENLKLKNYIPDIVVTLQPTSPLRRNHHIDTAITILVKKKNIDAVVSCVKVPHNFNPESLMQIKNNFLINTEFSKKIFDRHKKKQYFARNGAAIYVTRKKIIRSGLFNSRTFPFEMSFFESVDIDSKEDLKFAEFLYNYLKKR